ARLESRAALGVQAALSDRQDAARGHVAVDAVQILGLAQIGHGQLVLYAIHLLRTILLVREAESLLEAIDRFLDPVHFDPFVTEVGQGLDPLHLVELALREQTLERARRR